MRKSLINTSTHSKKGEDYTSTFTNSALNIKGVLVADGIGTCKEAAFTSKFVVEAAVRFLENLKKGDEINFEVLFSYIQTELIRYVSENLIAFGLTEMENSYFGSTLIIAIETENTFKIAYIGNGAIWHFRGDFYKYFQNQYLPWSVINMLNPHSVEENGKEALYKYFTTLLEKNLVVPTTLEISKDNLLGDIIMICTDGIYSYDQTAIGRVASGIWIHANEQISSIIKQLNSFLNEKNCTNEGLGNSIENYFASLASKDIFDDDASIGLIITEEAIH